MWEALEAIGTLLDTLGSVWRGVLAGDPVRAFGGIFDTDQRVSGQDMLSAWGWDDPGTAAGIGAELLLDPLNVLGGFALKGAMTGAKAAKANNLRRSELLATGGMPEEIARLTKVVDEAGNPLAMYHGTPQVGLSVKDLDPTFAGRHTGNKGFIGKGVYFSEDKPYANLYADNTGETLEAFIDSRNPYVTSQWQTAQLADEVGALPPWWDYGSQFSRAAHDRLLDETPPVISDILRNRGHDAVWNPAGARFGMPHPGELAVFDTSQIYAPWVAPAMRRVPRVAPVAAAIGGYNAVARFPWEM